MIKREAVQLHENLGDDVYLTITPFVLRPTEAYWGRRRVYRVEGANGSKGDGVRFTIVYPGGSDVLRIDEGFCTDLASIPTWCTPIVGPRDQYAEESILHDWFCAHKMPGFFANSKMRVVMSLLRRPRWKKLAVYWALRLFGYGSRLDILTNKVKETKSNE